MKYIKKSRKRYLRDAAAINNRLSTAINNDVTLICAGSNGSYAQIKGRLSVSFCVNVPFPHYHVSDRHGGCSTFWADAVVDWLPPSETKDGTHHITIDPGNPVWRPVNWAAGK